MRLSGLLDASPGVFIVPLRGIYEAAATAIEALGELELIRYDDAPTDGSADLSLWEEMAPLLGATIAAVNALLSEMQAHFPASMIPPDVTHARIHHVVQEAAVELRTEVSNFGMRVRDPAIVGDRWNLVAELQAFRYSTRNRIGGMVFDTASVLGDCRRPEVDPGYAEELAHALAIRTATTELRRTLKSRLKSVASAEQEDVEWNAQQLVRELKEFGTAKAWTFLRAQDKRQILDFRRTIEEISHRNLTKKELAVGLGPFVEFVGKFKTINQRDLLMQHDREVVAACGVAIERVMLLIAEGRTDDSVMHLKKILVYARSVYGRKSDFDQWLRAMGEGQFSPNDVPAACEQFAVLLSGLELY
jgi:hypothetical protein